MEKFENLKKENTIRHSRNCFKTNSLNICTEHGIDYLNTQRKFVSNFAFKK